MNIERIDNDHNEDKIIVGENSDGNIFDLLKSFSYDNFVEYESNMNMNFFIRFLFK